MDSYSSKLSMYDFIAMFMPGSIIAYCIMCFLSGEYGLVPTYNGFFWIFFFIVSYIIGIANHVLTSWFFSNGIRFRNCPKMIKDSIQWAKENGYDTDVDLEKITTQYCLRDKYYVAYYYAKKNAYGNDIEIMESQVAFLQALFLPVIIVFLLSLFPCIDLLHPLNLQTCSCHCRCMYLLTIWTSSAIAIILIIWLMIVRQRKIYRRVWEDYHYLKICTKGCRQKQTESESNQESKK